MVPPMLAIAVVVALLAPPTLGDRSWQVIAANKAEANLQSLQVQSLQVQAGASSLAVRASAEAPCCSLPSAATLITAGRFTANQPIQ